MPVFRRTLLKITATLAAFGAVSFAALPGVSAAETVNVYSYRQPELIKPLFEAFTKDTGIEVNFIFANKGLVERLKQEGPNSPADLLLSSDVARLVEAAKLDLVQPVSSDVILGNIPESLRDPQNRWFGLTMRARVVYASRDRVNQDTMSYAELADPKWKGKICIRPGQHAYNLGLIAAMIAHEGTDKTKAWLEGLKANLARKPVGNDRAQAKAIFYGECDLAVANTYYMGKMATNEKEPEQKDWAKATRIIFPTWPDGTTHVNISGMALTKHAPNHDAAVKLMEFLSSPQAQKMYAEGNFEYPVKPGIQASEMVKSWGEFKPDTLPVEKIAEHQGDASKLVDVVLFDQ